MRNSIVIVLSKIDKRISIVRSGGKCCKCNNFDELNLVE